MFGNFSILNFPFGSITFLCVYISVFLKIFFSFGSDNISSFIPLSILKLFSILSYFSLFKSELYSLFLFSSTILTFDIRFSYFSLSFSLSTFGSSLSSMISFFSINSSSLGSLSPSFFINNFFFTIFVLFGVYISLFFIKLCFSCSCS